MFRRLFRYRGLAVNLIVGFSFLMLAVYGWGLGWDSLGEHLIVIAGLSVGLIFIAALLGWLLRRLLRQWIRSRERK